MRSHIGVLETAEAPPDPAGGSDVAAADVSVEEAREITGLPFAGPRSAPEGFVPTTSRYYASPLTANVGGVLVLSYEAMDGSGVIDIFQEAASGADLAAPEGTAVRTTIGDLDGTYLSGAWRPAGEALVWQTNGTQTVVFEQEGVRTTIRHTGPDISPQALVNLGVDLAVGQRG
jgi:hypothetical protein